MDRQTAETDTLKEITFLQAQPTLADGEGWLERSHRGRGCIGQGGGDPTGTGSRRERKQEEKEQVAASLASP